MTTTTLEQPVGAQPEALEPGRTAKLFEPARIGRLPLKNRVVMPPMTRVMAARVKLPF